MNILPDIETLKAFTEKNEKTHEYNIFPIYCEILSDICTPIQAIRILKSVSDHCFLLESVAEREKWGRYTFLGLEPKLEITCRNGEMKIKDGESCNSENKNSEDRNSESKSKNSENRNIITNEPAKYIREILSRYKSPRIENMPSFTGGLVGFFAYDYMFYKEPSARVEIEDKENFNDVDLMLFDKVIAFDNVKQKIILIVNVRIDTGKIENAYGTAVNELRRLASLITCGNKNMSSRDQGGRLTEAAKPLFTKQEYCEMVEKAKWHIHEGDIFQIVLSNCLSAPFEGSLLDTYRILRTMNPSPYMFYLSGTDMEIAGASPETLVKLENGILHTFPLAGTRPRGKTEEEDIRLEKELLADEKELAEHNMLVDLGRNDIGKISKFGSVKVTKYHQIERYSHVMHIGSTVRGSIDDKYDALDAVDAVLPAGTLSGAPKIMACRLIGELENNKRGIYGGAIGYIDFTGNLDMCIAIRIAYKKNGSVFVRSGAGIVADSIPEREYDECTNKAAAVLNALMKAGECETETASYEEKEDRI